LSHRRKLKLTVRRENQICNTDEKLSRHPDEEICHTDARSKLATQTEKQVLHTDAKTKFVTQTCHIDGKQNFSHRRETDLPHRWKNKSYHTDAKTKLVHRRLTLSCNTDVKILRHPRKL